jgi:hypothetical protein
VAGLLGVTVVGAVLRSSESAALRSGTQPAQAFIDGYHSGLWLTIGLLAAGVALSYFTLRQRRQPAGTGDLGPAGLGAAELGLAELVLGEPLEPLGDVARGAGQAAAANVGDAVDPALPGPRQG